jgi:hypothetical protein
MGARGLVRRTGLVVAAAWILTATLGSMARAHVAIVLTIIEPSTGEQVGPDVTVVIQAQQTIGGVDSARFGLELDGRPVPPDGSGVIRVGEDARVRLRAVAPGRHVVTVRYRPDTDEPEMTNEVSFVVRDAQGSGLPVSLVAALSALALGAGFVAWRRLRTRR